MAKRFWISSERVQNPIMSVHRSSPCLIQINLIHTNINTPVNMLRVIFVSKLQWQPHFSNAIKKAKKSLHALNLNKPYFTNDEMRQLETSFFNSILYFNSEIWHIPTINHHSKQQLLSALSLALKLCTPGKTDRIRYN